MASITKESVEFLHSFVGQLEKDQYIIFGTGEVAQIYAEQLSNKFGDDSIVCFVDSTAFLKELLGKKVLKPSEIDTKTINQYKFILGTLSKSTTMKNTLVNIGVNTVNIINAVNYFSVENLVNNKDEIRSICYFPEITDSNILNELIERLHKYIYLEDCKDVSIDFIYSQKICETSKYKEFNYINAQSNYKQYDLILVWNSANLKDHAIRQNEKVICIDNRIIHLIDVKFLTALSMQLQKPDIKKYYDNISRNNYINLLEKAKKKKKAVILANGPLIKNGVDQFIQPDDDNLKIVCNQIYRDNDLLKIINPDIYCIVDSSTITPAFKEIYDGVISYIKNNDCMLVVLNTWIPYILHNNNELADKIIGLSIYAREINFPSKDNLSVMRSNNVATAIMTPIASSLCNQIDFIGCDGCEINEKGIEKKDWDHYGKMDKQSKLQKDNIQERNQCIFGKIDNIDEYYAMHVRYFQEIIEYGEKLGKKYRTLTPSYIPVLSERYIGYIKN